MFDKIVQFFRRKSKREITINELALFSCHAARLDIKSFSDSVKSHLKAADSDAETVEKLIVLARRVEDSNDDLTVALYFELLAYYQALVLIYVANIISLEGEELNEFGAKLNLATIEVNREDITTLSLTQKAIRQPEFHRLISGYLEGDTSISDLNESDFQGLIRFVGFDQHGTDFIMEGYVISFSRLINLLNFSYSTCKDAFILMHLWLNHSSCVNGWREYLKIIFKRAFPERVV